jgi:crossover junction endodeoxyribonuclease RuvC
MKPLLSRDPDASLRGEFEPMLCDAVLALDPGRRCGWALYSPTLAIARCGEIDLSDAADLGEMLAEFRDALDQMLAAHRPRILAMERPFGRSAFTSDLPGILVGVAHMVAFDHQTERREYTASAVKKGVTGSGKASKREVSDAVLKFGFAPTSDHQSDAAAVAVLAWNREAQRA